MKSSGNRAKFRETQVLGVKRSQIPLRARVETKLAWRDARNYERKLEIERQKIVGGFRAVVNRLSRGGLLDPRVVTDVKITTYVSDMRLPDEADLPEIEGVVVERIEVVKTVRK